MCVCPTNAIAATQDLSLPQRQQVLAASGEYACKQVCVHSPSSHTQLPTQSVLRLPFLSTHVHVHIHQHCQEGCPDTGGSGCLLEEFESSAFSRSNFSSNAGHRRTPAGMER